MASLAFSESTRRIEVLFQAMEAATITQLWQYCSFAASPPVLRLSLQGVDATTGTSDGTIKGATNNCLATFTPVSNTAAWKTLGESYTCARGEWLAAVLEYSSGTIDGSHSANMAYGFNGSFNRSIDFAITTTSGSRARSATIPVYGYASASLAYGRPIIAQSSLSFNSGSSPNEYALRFIVPSGSMTSFTIAGARILVSPNPAGTSHTVTLYDGTTVLQQTTFDTDVVSSSAAAPRMIDVLFTDATFSTLTPGNTYRLAIKPGSATNVSLQNIGVNANADLDAIFMGKEWYQSSRAGGAWTDADTFRPCIAPIFGAFTSSGATPVPCPPLIVSSPIIFR
jgi:hypothetical protein